MKKLIVLFSFIVLTSCAPIYVNYDFERGTDFNTYKTYNYYSDLESIINDILQLIDSEIR